MIKDFVVNNFVVRFVYRCKFYLDIFLSQVSWFTGKLPEVMAVAYLCEKAGVVLSFGMLVVVGVVFFVFGVLFGRVWHFFGFYDAEQLVNAGKNPVTKELLLAAKKINGDN